MSTSLNGRNGLWKLDMATELKAHAADRANMANAASSGASKARRGMTTALIGAFSSILLRHDTPLDRAPVRRVRMRKSREMACLLRADDARNRREADDACQAAPMRRRAGVF